jgi:hypothetical protein
MKKSVISPVVIGLASVVFLSSCSSMKIQREQVQKIKKVALIGFSVEQDMPNTEESVAKSLFGVQQEAPGGVAVVPAEIATASPHATQISQELAASLQKDLGWRVMDVKALAALPAYASFKNEKTKQPQMRPQVHKNVKIFVPDHGVETFLLGSMKHEERKQLMQKLGVDALALAHARIELQNSGLFKGIAGDLRSKAILSFRVFTAEQEEPVWMDAYAAGEATQEKAEHTLGFANVEALNKQALVAVRSAYKSLISRYKGE